MLNKYRTISVKSLSEQCSLSRLETKSSGLVLDSPAKSLMVDFTETPATTINETITVNDALEVMKAHRIRALMVVDSNGIFKGIITAMDLMGRKPMLYASEAGISRVDVLVKNMMTSKNKLKAVSKEDVEKSCIGDVLHTLKKLSEQHILVVEGDDDDMNICGLFSASDFKRALGVRFDTPVIAHTFSDLQRVINEQKEVI